MKQQRIVKEAVYPHPMDDVWRAISDAAAISEWFIKADFEPRVGTDYTFTHEQTTITGKVLEVEPPSLLVYTWNVSGTDAVTTVKWALAPEGAGTKLTIEHWGFEGFGENATKMFNVSTHGWDTVAIELEKYLAGASAASS